MCVCTDACVCVLTRVCDVLQVNRTVYTYRQDYAPNTKDGRYSFIVSPLTVKAQWCTVRGVFSVLQLTCTHRVLQNTYAYLMCLCMHVCLILFLPPSLIPPPPPQVTFPAQLSFQQFSTITLTKNCSLVAMPPVSQVNVTTPKPQWIVAGPQAVLLLDMQLYWAPPLTNITSYDVWVGAQPFSSSQSVPGKVQSFQVHGGGGRGLVIGTIWQFCTHVHALDPKVLY